MRNRPAVFTLTAILFCAVGFAGSHTEERGASGLPLRPVTSFLAFDGIPLKSDATGPFDFDYTIMNEYLNYLVESFIPPGRVLAGVGTFRMLNLASKTKPSHLVLFDYNKGVTLFNLIVLQLLQRSHDRWEFMSLLVTGSIDRDAIEWGKEHGVAAFVDRIGKPLNEAYEAWREKKPGAVYPDVFSKWRALGIRLPDEDDWDRIPKVKQDRLEPRLFRELAHRLGEMEAMGALKESIFGDDDRFRAARALVDQGKVVVMRADLAGTTGLASLAEAMEKRGASLGAIDISNVPPYLIDLRWSPAEKFNGMVANLNRFSPDDRARLLMTLNHPKVKWQAWQYYAMPVKKLGAFAADFFPEKLEKMGDYDRFRDRLKEEFPKRVPPVGEEIHPEPKRD